LVLVGESLVLPTALVLVLILILIPSHLDAQIWVRVAHVFQKGIVLLADETLLVMAGNVVPVNTIVVELVQKGEAVFLRAILFVFTIIGLGETDSTGGRPIALGTLSCGCKFLQGGGPEPAVYVRRLQVGAITALEVANAAAGPDVFYL